MLMHYKKHPMSVVIPAYSHSLNPLNNQMLP
jgi:hypothetical protein